VTWTLPADRGTQATTWTTERFKRQEAVKQGRAETSAKAPSLVGRPMQPVVTSIYCRSS
jgi:hypothetical protein